MRAGERQLSDPPVSCLTLAKGFNVTNGFYRADACRHTGGLDEPLALRPRQAAVALGVSESTLGRLTKAGAIPCIRLVSPMSKKRQRTITLYEPAVLKEYLAANRLVVGKEVLP
jgi:hypothetical protein